MSFDEAVRRAGVELLRDEPLAKHTTFRIGGPADWFAAAATIEQLETLAEVALEHGVPLTVLGGGSNLLISDAGIRGLVVANQARWHGPGAQFGEGFRHPALRADHWVAESGVMLAGMARTTTRSGLAGLEWAISIPGTVAGAVIGNAGAHGSDTAANVAWVLVRYPGSGRKVLVRDALHYTYRSSLLREQLLDAREGNRPVILAAGFDLAKGDPAALVRRADENLARRRASQPVEPSAGSIFRNPAGDFAGRLIESLGMKGHQIGGAQVSPRHANFIINTGGATAADVLALINLVRQRVFDATGHRLTPEILFLGEWTTPPLSAL